MTERRRGPAVPARRLAAGLSTAMTLGLIAGMAAAEAPTASAAAQSPVVDATWTEPAPRQLPAVRKRVVVVRRHHIVTEPANPAPAAPPAPTVVRQAPAPTQVVPQPAPAPAPAPAPPQPVTSSGGS